MATYYVRPDGNNSNTGTGSSAGQAWATIVYALGSTSAGGSGLVAGDILYIAPGVYRGAITLGMASAASTISIIGDPLCTQFAGVNAGEIILTVAATDSAISNSTLVSATSKNYISWQGILFDSGTATIGINMSSCLNWTFTKCTFTQAAIPSYTPQNIQAAYGAGVVANLTIDRCSCFGGGLVSLRNTNHTSSTNVNVVIKDVFCLGPLMRQDGANAATSTNAIGFTVYNCTTINTLGCIFAHSTVSGALVVRNSVFMGSSCLESAGLNGNISEDFNRFYSASPRSTVPSGANSAVAYHSLETLNRPLSGLPFSYVGASALNGANYNSGTLTGAPTYDLFTTNWSGINPDIGAIRWNGANGVSPYVPTEANQGSIEIASGQTSRSLYMYLGVTGLTATTTGLQAYYTKEDAAPVLIPLVPQTTTGAWVSGGFAEVSAANQPGVYRLDIPNAAISSGYTQTVVTVRGASGTNGAVVVVQEPQPAGWQVRMGPFTVQADGVLTDEQLKLFKGSIHSIDFKMVDQYGTGVDGTGTVVTANAYNSAGFLVDSYPCTAKYAEDGRYSFAIDATVTNVVGMYTINISRQIGSEINVFGRMKLEVLSP